jgi:hypothetical protein
MFMGAHHFIYVKGSNDTNCVGNQANRSGVAATTWLDMQQEKSIKKALIPLIPKNLLSPHIPFINILDEGYNIHIKSFLLESDDNVD